jgi:hypothetical protein
LEGEALKINPTTMLFEDLNDFQAEVLFNLATAMTDTNTANPNHEYFMKWAKECALDDRQVLFTFSTVFPIKAFQSVTLHFMNEYKELDRQNEDQAMERNLYS